MTRESLIREAFYDASEMATQIEEKLDLLEEGGDDVSIEVQDAELALIKAYLKKRAEQLGEEPEAFIEKYMSSEWVHTM